LPLAQSPHDEYNTASRPDDLHQGISHCLFTFCTQK
jgi:hypothetical protein